MIKFIQNAIISNPYMYEVDGTTLTNYIERADEIINYTSNVKFIYGLLQYGSWSDKNIDLLSFITPRKLHLLRTKPNIYFIFDCMLEGWSPFQIDFVDLLYKSCVKNNVPFNKVVFATSNLYYPNLHEKYVRKNNFEKQIKVIAYPHFKTSALNTFWDTTRKERTNDVLLRYMKSKMQKTYEGKIFISFSRINRKHRTLANYLLHINRLEEFGLISQNKLIDGKLFREEDSLKIFCREFDIDYQKFKLWSNTLPKTIDTDDFETNHANNLNTHIYSKALFEIVNETLYNDYRGTSLFYSEKTFKPMGCLTPFIIFGQKHCNQKLEDLGFKLYTDMFNYEFDNIDNTKQRYIKIIESITPLIQKLNSMNKQEQIAWKFKNEDTLLHNLDVLRNEFTNVNTLVPFLESIKADQAVIKS